MYAVIQAGGKQYRVQPGDVLQIEKVEGEVGKGMTFDQVLFTSKMNPEAAQVTIGKPLISGAKVTGEIVGQGRGDKIIIVKMKRRKHYRRTQGHRQYYTQLLITEVDNGSGEKVTLASDQKAAKLAKFQSHLKAKGPAFSNPALTPSKRRPEGVAATSAATTSAPKAAKTEAKAPVKTAAKKTTAEKTVANKAKTAAKKTTSKK